MGKRRVGKSVGAAMAGAVLWASWAVAASAAQSVLFVGNSFTFGARSPVFRFHAGEITDLNGTGYGGVPALFKIFTREAHEDWQVFEETVGGQDIAFHLAQKRGLIDKPWDHVVLQSYSTLDAAHPGDPANLVRTVPEAAAMFHRANPQVDVRLMATWSRADQTYPADGHWHGKPIEQMARDIRAAYDAAAAASPFVNGVLPVGDAWNRAFQVGFADPNPYDGIAPGEVDLWTWDGYHASAYGYYLEALVVFGALTGKDPLSLGSGETAAADLGFSPAQTHTLQQIAHDELAAQSGGRATR